VSTVIEYDGEQYVTVAEVAWRFKISRGTCYSNMLQYMHECYLPGRKNAMYRLSEVEQFSQVRIVEKQAQPLAFNADRHYQGLEAVNFDQPGLKIVSLVRAAQKG